MGHTTPPGWPVFEDVKFYCTAVHIWCVGEFATEDHGIQYQCLTGAVIKIILDQDMLFFPLWCAPAFEQEEDIIHIQGPYDTIDDCLAICHA